MELGPGFILKLTILLRITLYNVRLPYTQSMRPKRNVKNSVVQMKHIKTSFTVNFLLYNNSVKLAGLEYNFAENYRVTIILIPLRYLCFE